MINKTIYKTLKVKNNVLEFSGAKLYQFDSTPYTEMVITESCNRTKNLLTRSDKLKLSNISSYVVENISPTFIRVDFIYKDLDNRDKSSEIYFDMFNGLTVGGL